MDAAFACELTDKPSFVAFKPREGARPTPRSPRIKMTRQLQVSETHLLKNRAESLFLFCEDMPC